MAGTNGPGDSPDDAAAVVLEESRRVLDHQIDSIDSVDEKAIRTLRIGGVLLGVLVSGTKLLGVSNLPVFSLVGVAFIVLSLVVGIVAYSVSDADVGAGPENVERKVPDSYARSDVYDALLAIHEDSIAFNRRTLRTNEWYLTLSQGLLVAGVSLTVAGFLASI